MIRNKGCFTLRTALQKRKPCCVTEVATALTRLLAGSAWVLEKNPLWFLTLFFCFLLEVAGSDVVEEEEEDGSGADYGSKEDLEGVCGVEWKWVVG